MDQLGYEYVNQMKTVTSRSELFIKADGNRQRVLVSHWPGSSQSALGSQTSKVAARVDRLEIFHHSAHAQHPSPSPTPSNTHHPTHQLRLPALCSTVSSFLSLPLVLTTPAPLLRPAHLAIMGAFNIFRVAADLSHILSKFTLMWAIHWNRSAEVCLQPRSSRPRLTAFL
jgi:hypothetical protein